MPVEDIKKELSRCLGCKPKPCEKACPLGVSPHDFIAAAKNDDFKNAAAGIATKNPLPQTCGLVCPDKFCQKSCIRARIDSAIEIPCLQALIMHKGGYPDLILPPANNKKAAVIGGGPAGIGAVHELLLSGWHIDLYEKSAVLGGAVRLIPAYRLPPSVLDMEIARITKSKRVNIKLNHKITDFESLKKSYDGIILALGETTHRNLDIKGEKHCLSYEAYLKTPKQYHAAKVAVFGGGEVALDCALTAKKQGAACVEMFVRRRREDMRIQSRDQAELDRMGIVIRDLTSVMKITARNSRYTLHAVTNRINEQGKAEHLLDSAFKLSGYDMLIQALGSYYPKEEIPEGFMIAGDMTGTNGTIVQALASGRDAARRLIKGEN